MTLDSSQEVFVFPVSFAQQRLWFLSQFETEKALYNIPAAFSLSGVLNERALEKSFNLLINRHETLRTTFSIRDGQPVQVIAPTRELSLPVTDLSYLSQIEQADSVKLLTRQEADYIFDLQQGPLWRAKLLRLGPESHILLLNMHHIISDGWSMDVLWRDLSVLYTSFRTGQQERCSEPAEGSPLPELALQYADFSAWQRQWLSGEELERQLSYWKKQLLAAPPLINLPTDRTRPVVQTHRGANFAFSLSVGLTEALKRLSKQQGGTLFMTLLSAFNILLHRYSGQDDLLVGTPIANRNREEIEGLIGFFVNTLVLRTTLSGDPTFVELLAQVREVCLGAYMQQDLPFEKLVEELQPERSLSHNPLFQVMFMLHNMPTEPIALPGLAVRRVESYYELAKFDITLAMFEVQSELRGSFNYNGDLFDKATISHMASHFQTLLEGIVANPEKTISDLPILTEAERHQLLVEWNDTQRDYPKELCIHQLFEVQVERTPDAVAVIFDDEQLTYRQLNRRANQLAHHLIKLGVGPEIKVGICLERSLEMVVGLLGILKARGAYVALDPSYPQERLAFMLSDAKVPVLLTKKQISLPHTGHNVYLDSDWETIARESTENPAINVTPDELAYVLYTSGSTGKPKGVLGLHHGIVNRISWMQQTYPFKAHEICCQKTSLSFVDSVAEIFGPLINGKALVLIPDEVVRDPSALITKLAEHQITRLVLVPSLLRAILDTPVDLASRLPNLGLWISSGETLSTQLVERFHKSMPRHILLNLYGSSELSADVTWYETKQGHALSTVPIGRPIANTQTYILDPNLQPVPIGVPGMLYLAGVGLARGYMKPEFTSKKFIPNPFGAGKLYKTGDLARYLPDGNLEFLGRRDNQVKIRGFRIELGEIEAILKEHAQIQDAVVVAQTQKERLVAYAVSEQLTGSKLRRYLLNRVPEYMIPAIFVPLERLPLTPNGKVDRGALPAPDMTSPLAESFVPPHTPALQVVANVWQEVLAVSQVGIHDNFFELGGHSLLATQLIFQLQALFQVDLPLRKLFEAPTVEGVVEALAQLWGGREIVEEIARTWQEIAELSEEETKRMIQES